MSPSLVPRPQRAYQINRGCLWGLGAERNPTDDIIFDRAKDDWARGCVLRVFYGFVSVANLNLSFYLLVNLAINQTAEQSSTKDDAVASKAIDENFESGKNGED